MNVAHVLTHAFSIDQVSSLLFFFGGLSGEGLLRMWGMFRSDLLHADKWCLFLQGLFLWPCSRLSETLQRQWLYVVSYRNKCVDPSVRQNKLDLGSSELGFSL